MIKNCRAYLPGFFVGNKDAEGDTETQRILLSLCLPLRLCVPLCVSSFTKRVRVWLLFQYLLSRNYPLSALHIADSIQGNW